MGCLTNPIQCLGPGRSYGCECNENDIIEMTLDCNQWTLSYKINDKDFGKAFDVKPNKYRAATHYLVKIPFNLRIWISYQHIY